VRSKLVHKNYETARKKESSKVAETL